MQQQMLKIGEYGQIVKIKETKRLIRYFWKQKTKPKKMK